MPSASVSASGVRETTMQGAPDASALIGLGAVFTLLFITLGSLKIVDPFAHCAS